jgi:hypothetical protein
MESSYLNSDGRTGGQRASTIIGTAEDRDALADRIAAVIRERRRIGEERRRQQRESQRRSDEHALVPRFKLRGEPKHVGRRVKKLDEVYGAVISSDVADEALKAALGLPGSTPTA